MEQVPIPIVPISERLKMRGIVNIMEKAMTFYDARGGSAPELFLFEPCKEPNKGPPKASLPSAETELVAVALGKKMRDAAMEALKRVEAREPEFPGRSTARSVNLDSDMRFKKIFLEMAALPATVVSFPLSTEEPGTITLFLLRTQFTVSEFQREIQRPMD